MKRIISLLLSIVPGCGTLSDARYNGPTSIDPDLAEVVKDWSDTCTKHLQPSRCDTRGIAHIILVDKFDDDQILGQCNIRWENFEEVRRIYILREIPRDGYFIKAVFLHEMMHCRMRFERHQEAGVMGEYMRYSETTLARKWPELLEETYKLVR